MDQQHVSLVTRVGVADPGICNLSNSDSNIRKEKSLEESEFRAFNMTRDRRQDASRLKPLSL